MRNLQHHLPGVGALMNADDYEPKTSLIHRAELFAAVRETVSGPGIELFRMVLRDLDSAELIIRRMTGADMIEPTAEQVGCGERESGHDKVFSGIVYLTSPSQHLWICSNCGWEGIDRGQVAVNEYEAVKARFRKDGP